MCARWIAQWKCRRGKLHSVVCRYLDAIANIDMQLPLEGVRFVVLDTETSGLNPWKDQLLSIGAVAITNLEIVIADSFEAVVRQDSQEALRESISIHGLRPKDLQKGRSIEEVLSCWLQYVRNSVLVGQHVAFDQGIISAHLKRLWGIRLYNPGVDTAQLAMRIEHPSRGAEEIPRERYSLDKLAERYHLRPEERHTAIGDAFLTAQLFLILVRQLQSRGVRTLRDLLRVKQW